MARDLSLSRSVLCTDRSTGKSPADGTPLSGLVYALRGCPADAGLVVHVHGGPAITVIADRAAGANSTRYPYRHLLKAGPSNVRRTLQNI